MKRYTQLLVFVLIAVLMLGVVGSAAAQGPGGNDDDPQDGPSTGPAFGDRGPRGEFGRFAMERLFADDAAVAAAFGITEAELQAFYDAGLGIREIAQELDVNLDNVVETLRVAAQADRNAMWAAAFGISVEAYEGYVEQGLGPREIAQALNVNFENVLEQMRAEAQAERNAALAAAFGISVDELDAYFAEGLTIREIAQELDINLDNVLEESGLNGPRGRFGGQGRGEGRGDGFPGRGQGRDGRGFNAPAPNTAPAASEEAA